jgi:glycerol uptake facilitator-like aquaporin
MIRMMIVALLALVFVGVAGAAIGHARASTPRIPKEIFELARLQEKLWAPMLASLTGPVMAYDNIISRDDATR